MRYIKPSLTILDVSTDIFTAKFSELLLEKTNLINSYINKIKSNKYLPKIKSTDILSAKNNPYYLNKIIKNLDKDNITNLVLYNFFKLLTYHDGNYENINQL